MELVRKARVIPRRLAVLPGTFNPLTRAHLGLANAALSHTEEVLFVIPRTFPHKEYTGATLAERLHMLERAIDHPRASIALTEKGLFIDIARELKVHYPDSQIVFVCGRDAAERIVNWDYGEGSFEAMLAEFHLLVAAREGTYVPPRHLQHGIEHLACDNFDEISSTDVRKRIAQGEPWEHLVPPSIEDAVRTIYSTAK